ncbi:MAG: aminopeptidase N [bacterium P3]|nr:MAG: aminopeptidase N [bacterium P201]KWW30362.1 MAG: aminopeptidase N [bacterium P3]KWW32857.1 MAG: aminopeptidase N [bacterium F083]
MALSSLLLACATGLHARQTDTVDVLHYELTLQIRPAASPYLTGCADLTVHQLTADTALRLDLAAATVDSVCVDGQRDLTARYSSPVLTVGTAAIAAGDTFHVTVFYRTDGYTESMGMGGFHAGSDIGYNLGVALREYPHNLGKAWFPCRDNFTDRATYTLHVNTAAGWTAQCGGTRESVRFDEEGNEHTTWHLPQSIPTYLISVAAAPWNIIERNFDGLYATYPATLGYLHHDSAAVQRAFDNLERVLPRFEACFGPYRWDRIGYMSTPLGSMEHVNNICLHTEAMASTDETAQSTIAHELSHSWFGNLITCSSAADMWFNEGGASFCEEVAMEAIHADDDPLYHREYYLKNLEQVLRTCHLDDGGGYRPLYNQPHRYTYGMTTYNKGALMWHSLRGHLGDSLFYAALRTLFDRNAFTSMNGRQVRDSLAAYSGTPLDDFFDFHVYGGGFVDWVVDSLSHRPGTVTLHLRQRLLGTDTPMRGCRVPVTLIGASGERQTVLMTTDSLTASQSFDLSFRPVHAIVDYDETTARACTSGNMALDHRGVYRRPVAHFNGAVTHCGDSLSWLRVEHHWLPAEGRMPYGVLRTAKRYWNIIGDLTEGTRLSGVFFYCREAVAGTSYPHLDHGFYELAATSDSLRLLYRPDSQAAWQVTEAAQGGTTNDGQFLVTNLQPGEYTLAVVDTALLAIRGPQPAPELAVSIHPNPSAGDICIDTRDTEPCTVSISDMAGRRVVHARRFRSHIELTLPKGLYTVRVESETGHRTAIRKLVVQ